MQKGLLLASSLGLALLGGCENTFFGDADPNFNSPFNEGEVNVLEPPSLTNLTMAVPSESHPGTFYAAEDVTGQPRLVAFDDGGSAQGEVLLGGVIASGWIDLAIRDSQLLLLQNAGGTGVIHRYDEPTTPPPFSGDLERRDSLSFAFPDATSVDSCLGLGAARGQNVRHLRLLCQGRFYRLSPDFGEAEVQVAVAEDAINLLRNPGNLQDFSVSPDGQFAMLVGSEQALVAQASDENEPNWGSRFSGSPSTINWDESFSGPVSGSYAFNSVLVYLFAPGEDAGRSFAIFAP